MVNNSVVVWGFEANHFAELGAFSSGQRFCFILRQGFGVLIVLFSAFDHLNRHCGVVGVVLVEVENPLQTGSKVLCITVCFFIAIDIDPFYAFAYFEFPGQTAIFAAPLFCDTWNQLTLWIGLQQAVHQAGQVFAVFCTLGVEDVESFQFSGCKSCDVQVFDFVFAAGFLFFVGAFSICLATLGIGLAVAALSITAASAQYQRCSQCQSQQFRKCLFHVWLFLLRFSTDPQNADQTEMPPSLFSIFSGNLLLMITSSQMKNGIKIILYRPAESL